MNENSIDGLNKNSVDNIIPYYYTYLNKAVRTENLRDIKILLEKGANPNGVSNEGLPSEIPFTTIDFKSGNFKTIVRMMLRHGSDINAEDLGGNTILTSLVKFFTTNSAITNRSHADLVPFILERGANPNGTIFQNPLDIITHSLRNLGEDNRDFFYNFSKFLIVYGANPKTLRIELSQFGDNLYTNASMTLDAFGGGAYTPLRQIFNTSVRRLVSECEPGILIESVAKYYKIPYDGSKESLPGVCKSIGDIYDYKDKYNENKFIGLRRKMRKTRAVKCNNEDLINGAEIDSFPDSELIFLDEKNPDFRYCFHLSDIHTPGRNYHPNLSII
jgi:hypothetical protein